VASHYQLGGQTAIIFEKYRSSIQVEHAFVVDAHRRTMKRTTRKSNFLLKAVALVASLRLSVARAPFFATVLPSTTRWFSASLATSQRLLAVPRGGGAPGAVSADPEGVTLQGTTSSLEKLYLPGLLDTGIRRTNKVRRRQVRYRI
jgi:hypothetical protein